MRSKSYCSDRCGGVEPAVEHWRCVAGDLPEEPGSDGGPYRRGRDLWGGFGDAERGRGEQRSAYPSTVAVSIVELDASRSWAASASLTARVA